MYICTLYVHSKNMLALRAACRSKAYAMGNYKQFAYHCDTLLHSVLHAVEVNYEITNNVSHTSCIIIQNATSLALDINATQDTSEIRAVSPMCLPYRPT